ncbi:zinc ABC transporter substrate-binding protein [uncultured Roseivirga sp.]|jgi:manganese/zinc/iron transport system substrate-binding protein|uniref:metal ABC transporter solute-binding protein, Zn/Mn family n=1 Tax=uncultured Roseivirga sp. TaxID=543088 RepID=UPI000D7AFE6B|nr:zinc ABC transporter substrate-binding protein [uncultured Roseivirga sp.]PWL28594.1 MAG: manganese transporter [Roseivirga sp. XM-24bin3]
MKKYLIILLAAFALWSCGTTNQENSGKLNIVATTGMVADIAKNVGKDSVNVTALMGPGVDPHLYKATQGDLGKLQAADIILYNGLHLEGKMGEVFEKLERIKTVVPVARSINEAMLLDDPVYQGTFDPHIWFDVSLWMQTVVEVTNTLIEARPELADYFKANADAYREELADLHEWVINEMQSIPPSKRIMITAHDAFSYFGRAYGIEVRGLQGISTLSEFGLKDRVDLINFIVDKQIKAVFVETSVSEKNIKAIVEGCAQKGHTVEIGGNLFSDAMGAAGTAEGNYVGMVKSNVRTIVEALK